MEGHKELIYTILALPYHKHKVYKDLFLVYSVSLARQLVDVCLCSGFVHLKTNSEVITLSGYGADRMGRCDRE